MFSALSFFFQALPVCSLKSHVLILYFCDKRALHYFGIITPLRAKRKINLFFIFSHESLHHICLHLVLKQLLI